MPLLLLPPLSIFALCSCVYSCYIFCFKAVTVEEWSWAKRWPSIFETTVWSGYCCWELLAHSWNWFLFCTQLCIWLASYLLLLFFRKIYSRYFFPYFFDTSEERGGKDCRLHLRFLILLDPPLRSSSIITWMTNPLSDYDRQIGIHFQNIEHSTISFHQNSHLPILQNLPFLPKIPLSYAAFPKPMSPPSSPSNEEDPVAQLAQLRIETNEEEEAQPSVKDDKTSNPSSEADSQDTNDQQTIVKWQTLPWMPLY